MCWTEADGNPGHCSFTRSHTCFSNVFTVPALSQAGWRSGYEPKVVETSPSPALSTSRRSGGTTPFRGHLSVLAPPPPPADTPAASDTPTTTHRHLVPLRRPTR